MICRNCGEDNEEGLEICAFCGEELGLDAESTSVSESEQLIVEKENNKSAPKRTIVGDEKIIFAVLGFGLILIVVITIAFYSLLKNLLSSTSDWFEEKPTSTITAQLTSTATTQPISTVTIQTASIATIQPTSTATTQPTSIATNLPTSIATANPTEIYQPSDQEENLFYGIRSETVYRPFQSIGILTLESLEQEVVVADPNGLLPIMMSPEAGQSFISPDHESLVLSTGYGQGEILIFRVGDLEPFYQMEGYPGLGQFHSFSPDGKYFSFPSRDPQTSEFMLNVLDLELGGLYQQIGLLYGIFLPSSDQAIGFRVRPTDDRVISLERIDFLKNQTTSLLNLDLSLDDITYIPPFLSRDGKQVFYVDGDSLRSFSLQSKESKFIYKFEFVYEARAFCLYQSDKVAIPDGLDPDLADLYLYHPLNDHLVKIDRRVSTTAFHFEQRNFANVPSIALSPDGMRIAYAGGQIGVMELRVAELDGGEVIPLSDKVQFISFKFSPDNRTIAFIEFNDSSEYGDLYITDVQGEKSRLVDNNVISFEYTSGGENIVYSKYENPEKVVSQSAVYVIGVDGEGKDHLLDKDGTFVFIHVP